MGFEGFGEYAIDFYDGLEADNSKSYWDANLATYQADVRAPMEALLAELVPEFGDGFGTGKVFRPYRDVRFAKDKTPYKTHCGAVIEQGRGGGAYYVEVGPAGLRVGGGCFHFESDQLARFRKAVDTELRGAELAKILAKLEKAGWEIKGDRLKSKPRGFAEDHPRIDLLKYRSVYAVRGWEPDDVLHEPGALDRVRKAWRQVRVFNEWARDRVGPSEKPRR
ncbi:DUF2461 domain-containing protein [Amycolatopsis umgeniensis]|uniref:Uncharacterized protein (TIGR02453 family) n=1 Tax=Amycolatopsis umgeniensis TaxID=336628 RepID=A0A841BDU4_9PSEU|nr:DUF2461 domain-containing protein [Amycolatopsis umgeniensis]MBB5856752.1 uncharacterized protein (TIGR02453 family) [Amycolatopsis umgeniensis]